MGDIYYLANYAGRNEIVAELNDYYRSLGVPEEHLLNAGDSLRPADTVQPLPSNDDTKGLPSPTCKYEKAPTLKSGLFWPHAATGECDGRNPRKTGRSNGVTQHPARRRCTRPNGTIRAAAKISNFPNNDIQVITQLFGETVPLSR